MRNPSRLSGRDNLANFRTQAGIATQGTIVALALLVSGCGSGSKSGNSGAASREVTVGFVIAKVEPVPLISELPGRTVAFQSSEVRPQVSGVIERRFFTEGSLVKRGQPLYQIDPSLYRAAANQADANLKSAQATAQAARVRADRYAPLAKIEAVSQQDYTDALATARQAGASVAQTRAALDTAKINLRFTTVPAPITGRIGRSLFTVGALVTTSQADPLATIQQLDPIFVDIQQSSADLLALRRALSSKGVTPARADVRLKLEDGSDYGITGSVEFSEVVVDQSTGTVALRARFANPQGLLLPGMFVRAIFAQVVEQGAILVPQQAVSRDPAGRAIIWIVSPQNKVAQRVVTTERTSGANWVVTGGLKPGERIITQGIANLRADMSVKAVPASTPQPITDPQGSASGKAG